MLLETSNGRSKPQTNTRGANCQWLYHWDCSFWRGKEANFIFFYVLLCETSLLSKKITTSAAILASIGIYEECFIVRQPDLEPCRMATYFTKPNFYQPLTQNVDNLPGRHANTHLAQARHLLLPSSQYWKIILCRYSSSKETRIWNVQSWGLLIILTYVCLPKVCGSLIAFGTLWLCLPDMQVNGFAAGYKTSGDQERRQATSNFFDIITGGHSYATGGNNDGEYWGAPYQLASTISGVSIWTALVSLHGGNYIRGLTSVPWMLSNAFKLVRATAMTVAECFQEGSGRNTEETCTTYNMMKTARYLFQWSGNARYADYYERAVLNGMLGVQRIPVNYTSTYSQSADLSTTLKRRYHLALYFDHTRKEESEFPKHFELLSSHKTPVVLYS